MQILYGPDFKINTPTAVTIGKFDGLHSGHLRVVDRLKRVAKEFNLDSVVYTFDVNPRLVLQEEKFLPLMSNKEKSDGLELLGVDFLVFEEFNLEFSEMLPEEFVKDVLVGKLNAKFIIMGENSTFGKDRSGNVTLMKKLGERYGFKVEVVELLKENGEVISSSKIRGTIVV